jgi:phenylacetate-coenzyme A ligase PaaK-like adenylate-forming protein
VSGFCLDPWHRERLGFDPVPETLRAWQAERAAEVVRHARAASPFYRRKFAGLPENAPHAALPRTTPAELAQNPDAFLCASRDEVARVVTLRSSGTTGEAKRLFHSAGDLERTAAFFSHGMRQMADPGDGVLILLPGDTSGGVAALLSGALARWGARGLAHGPLRENGKTMEDALACIRDEGARCVVGSPAQVNALALAWEARGLPGGAVRSVLLCWDAIPEAVAANAQRALGCEVFRHWGMVETGLGGAVDCTAHRGMHLREADMLVEAADPDTGAPLPDGESGELVVTTLSRRVMPLIRYRTGDMGRILPGRCACGSALRRMEVGPRLAAQGDADAPLPLAALNELAYGVAGLADFLAEYAPGPISELRVQTRAARGASRAAVADVLKRRLEAALPPGWRPEVACVEGEEPFEPSEHWLAKRVLRRAENQPQPKDHSP